MTMKHLVILMLLLTGGPATSYGQGRDTAFAVRKLFTQKRHGGKTSAASGASMVTEAATLNGALSGLAVGAVPMLLGLHQAERFSALRQEVILSRYAEGEAIPADVRRQLRRKHFHRTAKDVALGR